MVEVVGDPSEDGRQIGEVATDGVVLHARWQRVDQRIAVEEKSLCPAFDKWREMRLHDILLSLMMKINRFSSFLS